MDHGLQMSLVFRGRWCQRNQSRLSSVVTNWWIHQLSRKKGIFGKNLGEFYTFLYIFFFYLMKLVWKCTLPDSMVYVDFLKVLSREIAREGLSHRTHSSWQACVDREGCSISQGWGASSWQTTFVSLHSPMSPSFDSCSTQWRSFWSKGLFCSALLLSCSAPSVGLAQTSYILWFFNKE